MYTFFDLLCTPFLQVFVLGTFEALYFWLFEDLSILGSYPFSTSHAAVLHPGIFKKNNVSTRASTLKEEMSVAFFV